MHTDIREKEELPVNNCQIRLLMGDCVEEDGREVDFDCEIHKFVDADVSQAKAMRMAKGGRSFVLHGPPWNRQKPDYQ